MNKEVTIEAVKAEPCKGCIWGDCNSCNESDVLRRFFGLPCCTEGYVYKIKETK
jgi:hypothetical protein